MAVVIAAAQAAGFVSLMGSITKGVGNTVNLPEGMINIGGNSHGYLLSSQINWDPVASANRDTSFTALALGDDIYIYGVQSTGGYAQWIASKNATYPDGYTAANSRKVGGFHVGRTRPSSQRYNGTYVCPIEIVWNSCWDLQHRPTMAPEGMAEIYPGQWMFIYLASAGSGAWPDVVPVSRYNATPITGSEGYSYDDYHRLAAKAGGCIPSYGAWKQAAYGVPQGATGQAGRINTGLMTGYGFDCISCLNIDQPSGNIWQLCADTYDRSEAADGWKNTLNTGQDGAFGHGQFYGTSLRVLIAGGSWDHVAESGARCVNSSNAPWSVTSNVGFRVACGSR